MSHMGFNMAEKSMENNEKNDIQSRREFFREAAKKALPIIGAVALLSNPILANASSVENESMGCNSGCVTGCYHGCKGGCKDVCTSCHNGCKGGCKDICTSCHNGCKGGCKDICTGCHNGCKGSCKSSSGR